MGTTLGRSGERRLGHLVGERAMQGGELRRPLVQGGVARGAPGASHQLQHRVHLVDAAADRAGGGGAATLHIRIKADPTTGLN